MENIFLMVTNGNEIQKTPPATIPANDSSTDKTPRLTMLIVEDERLVAENLSEILKELGYEVVATALSGEQAIQKFLETKPDLILMDIRLKGTMDGVQTALVIEQTIKKVPIVFVTGHPEEQFPHLAVIDRSMFLYITKPYSKSELRSAIKHFFPE